MTRDEPTEIGRGLSSLRREIAIAGLAMAVIILIIAVVVLLTSREQTIDNATRKLAAVSHITAERTAQTFSATDLLVRSLRDLATKQPLADGETLRTLALKPGFYNALVSLQKLLPQISVAAVLDANGQLLATSDQYPAPPVNIADTPFFKALKSGEGGGFAMSDPIYDREGHRWVLYLGRAIADTQGRFAGVALAGILVDYFEGYFATIDSGRTGAVSLVNDRLVMVARWPRLESLIGKPIPGFSTAPLPAIGDTSLITYSGSLTGDRDARRAAVTRLSAQDMTLYLVIAQTETAMLASWRNSVIWIVLFAVASFGVLGMLAWFVLRAVREEERWRAALLERETRLSNQAIDLAAARDAAEMANRVRGEFLANMSHELRTPLNAVLGFAEILEKELFGPLGDPRYREFVVDIHSSGRHLLEIVGNILDLTKIDAGKLQLDEQDVDIVEIMQICGRLVAETAHSSDIALDICMPKYPVTLRADQTRLRQILLNLLSNAIKFTAKGTVRLSGEIVDSAFVLTVADTGIGMTAEETVQAMQPFRQIDNSLARRYQGTGLGLPLSKSLVELHGGEMQIESVAGVGTTVRVILPEWRVSRTASDSD
ncbi:MAG TPA: ATP-binding protein [Alphaproteobacteria bacterium]|nr:ATP-binding protein [Alphaproteobacteria bacterium]